MVLTDLSADPTLVRIAFSLPSMQFISMTHNVSPLVYSPVLPLHALDVDTRKQCFSNLQRDERIPR
jgi:hypothetical protein